MPISVIGEWIVIALKSTGCAAVGVAPDAGVERPLRVDVWREASR